MTQATRIIELKPDDETAVLQTAEILLEAFGGRAPEWPDIDSTLKYVRGSLAQTDPERINLVAVAGDGRVLGYAGGTNEGNGGFLWELDPLVVIADSRRLGIGRTLVEEVEERIRARGALTLWLGTDDWANLTSLGGTDLYPDVLGHLANIKNLANHPYAFYQKIGFVIVGVIPDSNGWGKPDILMAKRVAQEGITGISRSTRP
ncbi:MAG: GNAT family N-acetyltransferase [Thermoleophilia bacterium]|nr:GNAT family N-acetyltransferase [Thermoleophilia bacterium]